MLNRTRTFRILTLLVVGVLLVAAVGGCGPATPEPTEPPAEPAETEPPAEEPTEEPTEAPTEVPPTEPPEETTATIVMFQDPPSFNHAVTDTGYEAVVQEMVLLALTDLGPNGEVYPELAAEIPTLENGLVELDEENWTMDVTWQLRDDVYWEDGEPVTADDVVFTWEALADPDTGTWVPGMDYTESIEKVDDYTVLVHYNTVYPAYQEQFGGYYLAIWPEH
ncbi:MAG: ABC transporter substrate-binding protein, partial [Anaerolineae bacterium]